MTIRDRVRRVLGGSSTDSSLHSSRSSNFTSSSNATSETKPREPSINLTSSLSRSLTFKSMKSIKSQKTKEERALEKWAKRDAKEWKKPSVKYPFRKSQQHQDILRAFEFNAPKKGENNSIWSGISPFASRRPSLTEPSTLQKVASGSGSMRRRNSLQKGSMSAQMVEEVGRADNGCAVPIPEE
ncbi:hypothetical protein HYALB_00001687 [Hymenoscyphus albidus]|uniref:Uncharacterized protein n=1 Tax=Hymenoscyphus albidus TaxID=595503 RepID=A0A9N9LBP9_9HELO|nr:hypothetical protein HYALB_00001687 [Hymenoscyphus albidus]